MNELSVTSATKTLEVLEPVIEMRMRVVDQTA